MQQEKRVCEGSLELFFKLIVVTNDWVHSVHGPYGA